MQLMELVQLVIVMEVVRMLTLDVRGWRAVLQSVQARRPAAQLAGMLDQQGHAAV